MCGEVSSVLVGVKGSFQCVGKFPVCVIVCVCVVKFPGCGLVCVRKFPVWVWVGGCRKYSHQLVFI